MRFLQSPTRIEGTTFSLYSLVSPLYHEATGQFTFNGAEIEGDSIVNAVSIANSIGEDSVVEITDAEVTFAGLGDVDAPSYRDDSLEPIPIKLIQFDWKNWRKNKNLERMM
ncbi:MAG: hypothetical protein KTR21_03295 [Rhodobacteraceae bacterium]|nr:hypothetical protein [Paracoccaceae bacterium]